MIVVFRAVILLIAFAYGASFAAIVAGFVVGLLPLFGVIDAQTVDQIGPSLLVIGPMLVVLYVAVDNFTPLGRWRMRVSLGARPPSARERRVLDGIVEELDAAYAKRHGKRFGRINPYVTDSLEPNAMAFGANNIAVSRGLLKPALDDSESRAILEGVMAHELGHLHEKDTIFMGVVLASIRATDLGVIVLGLCFAPVIILTWGFYGRAAGMLTEILRNIGVFLAWLPMWLIATFSRMTAAPAEYRADRFAAELTGPDGLIKFFDLISPLDTRVGSGVIGHYMRSHPPTELRRDKMEQLAEN
jgi:Zn-dependent protease with chaperone function